MNGNPPRIVIINRSFWPVYPVIGEGLLRLAEGLAQKKFPTYVFMQGGRKNFKETSSKK